MPRWMCGQWTRELGWLHIVSDVAIFGAYMAIPACIVVLLLRRRDFPLRGIYWLFAAFILSCGTTHLVDSTMFYHPAYRLLGVLKFITAAVSWFTVFAVARELPKALKIPALLRSKEDLERNLAGITASIDHLRAERKHMEDRTAQLTVRDRRLRNAMFAARAAAVCWEPESGRIVWDVGLSDLLLGPQNVPATHWRELIGDEQAARLHAAAMDSIRQHTRLVIEIPLAPQPDRPTLIRIRGEAEPPADGEPTQIFALLGSVP